MYTCDLCNAVFDNEEKPSNRVSKNHFPDRDLKTLLQKITASNQNTPSDIRNKNHIGMALHTHLFHTHKAFHTAYIGDSIACSFAKSSYNFRQTYLLIINKS